ncbi:MAG TPA: glycosyltransferase family protein, partial [Chitinophagaceae bacterium]
AIGEWILKNYARASHYIGLHFEQYDDFILPPVIKKEILEADPVDKGYITVYLPSYAGAELEKTFRAFGDIPFHIFSKETKEPATKGNITFMPVNKTLFNKSLTDCSGIICGAGFETPAEALYLGKKILCIPTRGQYEQLCNAAALEGIGVKCVKKINNNFAFVIDQWLRTQQPVSVKYNDTIPDVLDELFSWQASTRRRITNEPMEQPVELLQALMPYSS